MRALIVGLLMSAAGLWWLGRALLAVRRGVTRRFFNGPGDRVTFSSAPLTFVGNAGMWVFSGALLTAVGGVMAFAMDPLVALASPAGVVAAVAIAMLLRRRGGRSGDAGAGAFEALAEADREAIETRVEALPEGGERSVLRRVLDAWPAPPPPEGDYRKERPRRVPADETVLARAIAAEQRALRRALLPAVAGVVPAVVFVVMAPSIRFVEAAALSASVDGAIALGALVVWRVAAREHTSFAAAAREAARRLR